MVKQTNITRQQAWELLNEYNDVPFLLNHGKTVEGILRYFACELGYDDEAEYWGIVGLLHDIDFQKYPNEHCEKCVEILRAHTVNEDIINSIVSHGAYIRQTKILPEHEMEKILYAVDELSGLIGAVALMRPSKSVQDLGLSSVKKKFKQKSFAEGCSRETIERGAQMLGWEIDDLITKTIEAMRTLEEYN